MSIMNFIDKCTIELWHAVELKDPISKFLLCGSAVLITKRENYYLLTAYHVFKDNKLDQKMLHLGGDFVSLGGEILNSPKFDIAVLHFTDSDLVKQISKEYQFLDFSHLKLNHRTTLNELKYLLYGFPSSRAKLKRDPNYTRFSYRPSRYTTEVISATNIHIDVGYTKTEGVPDPVGMSGSGLWYTLDADTLNTSVQLVGLMVEWHPQSNFVRAVKIDYVCRVIDEF